MSVPTPVASAAGNKPNAATSAVIMIGRMRRIAPSRIASAEAGAAEAQFVDIGNIDNRRCTETPNNARKPTPDETENGVPVSQSATKPPTGADNTTRWAASWRWLTGTPFSVSSGVGFLALFGALVLTAVVYISYVDQLRLSAPASPKRSAKARSCGCARSRAALVAALGLLPAALATGVGTDTQRPFALRLLPPVHGCRSASSDACAYTLVARPVTGWKCD